MELGIGEWIVIVISAILLIWFFIGNLLNHQRSQKMLAWMLNAAQSTGKVTSGRMLAPSAEGPRAMIKIDGSPIRQIEILLRLLRRENLPLWLYQLIINRKDEVTLKLSITSILSGELMAFQTKNATREVELANRAKKQNLVFLAETPTHRLYYRQRINPEQVERLRDFLQKAPETIHIIIQSENPQLIFKLPTKALFRLNPQSLLSQLHDLM